MQNFLGRTPTLKKFVRVNLWGASKLFLDEHVTECRGRWREALGGQVSQRLCLEVGSHLGKTLVELAEEHTDTLFIGSDITYKRVVSSAERLERKKLANAAVLLGDMKQIERFFKADELDLVMIFFPDPWSKKAQRKHRLINVDFAEAVKGVLAKTGVVWVKMDQLDYFEQTKESLKKAGFSEAPQSVLDIKLSKPTTFERKFNELGRPTYEGFWVLENQ